jgi:hypothetical protein
VSDVSGNLLDISNTSNRLKSGVLSCLPVGSLPGFHRLDLTRSGMNILKKRFPRLGGNKGPLH